MYYNENKLKHAKILEFSRKPKTVSSFKCLYICFLILVLNWNIVLKVILI